MGEKDIIKIIKEEVADFDFLGNDAHLREEENNDLLKNEEFQRQFIVDSLLNDDKIEVDIKDSKVDGNWEDSPTNQSRLTMKYVLVVEYKYDKNTEPVEFNLAFSTDGIEINAAPEDESWFDSFKWDEISVDLLTSNDDEIKFKAYEKAPTKIKKLFVKEYVKDYIADVTEIGEHTSKTNDIIQNVSHY